MDKLKQTFSRSKETEADDTATAGATGKVTGQGSHFSSTKAMDRDTLGATAAAQQDAAAGGPTPDPKAAQATGGPEQGGSDHVGTVNPSQLSQSSSEPPVGQTTTYSTHQLGKGDPTPSVVDPGSSDPTTFKKPESTAPAAGSAGVPPNAAQAAASKAFSGSARGEGMPGAYPSDTGYENPYRAENLDPRVDSLPIRSKDNTHAGTAAAAAGTAVGAGAASTSTGRDTSHTAAETSVLPSTVDSADKSADYSRPQETQSAASGAASQEDQDKQSSGFVGKALAAVGLGGAAGAAGYGLANKDGKDSAVGDTTLPADSTPKPTHGRKESIPTTAYPAGVDSPRAINPPVGGTTSGTGAPSAAEDSHTGRNAAIGAGGSGAAGAAGYGASQYADRKDNEPSRTVPATATTIGQDNTSKLREDLTGQPSGISSEARDRAVPAEEESHTGRNVALGAAGLGAAGAAGYGASRHTDQKDNEPSRIAPATATTLGQDNTSQLRDDLASQPSGISPAAKDHAAPASTAQTTSATAPSAQPEAEDHTKRNAALAAGGVGVGAGAAGAYTATRDNKQEPFGHTAIYGPDTTSTSAQPAISGQPTAASTTAQPASAYDQSRPKEEEDHTGRNAALAGAAGAGAVGAGAYATHEASKKHAEEETAKQAAAAEKERKAAEKARAEQQKAHEKELEKQEKKQQKEADKSAKKEEKEHQKEVAAMEKQRTKEEKEHQKEVAAMEKQRTKEEEERRRQQEEEEDRKKKAAAAAVGGAGVAGAGAYAYDKSKEDESPKSPTTKSEEKEKKPGLFKRIFKRRKNKDTGESEEYSSDEEQKDDSHKGAAVAGTAAGTGALGAGAAYGAHEREDRKLDTTDPSSSQAIGTAHSTDEPQTRYEAVSGGSQKPSYNPLAKDDPSKAQAFDQRTGHQAEPLQYDNQRATTTGTTGSSTGAFPVEPTTGLPYDPSKDPAAAQRLREQELDTPTSTEAGRASVESGEPGSPSEKRGFRQKLKEAITGHKEEDGDQHGDHSVLHKKSHQIPEEAKTSSEGP